MQKTKPLSRREYKTQYWTARDLILEAVRKEELQFIKQLDREIRPDFRPHKAQWSEVVKHAFAGGIIQFLP